MSLRDEITALTTDTYKLIGSIDQLQQTVIGTRTAAKQALDQLKQTFGQDLSGTQLFGTGAGMLGPPPFALGDELEQKLGLLLDDIGDINDGLEELPDKLGSLAGRIDDACTNFEESVNDLNDTLDDHFDHFSSVLEAYGEQLTDGFESILDEAMQEHDKVIDKVEEFLGEALVGKPQEALEDAEKVLIGALESSAEVVEDISGELVRSFAASLEELVDYIADSAEEAVTTAADRLVDLLVDRVAAEATEAVFEVQVGAQVTMTLQPYLPQLMVAGAVAPAVQSALDVMRAGV